ncbi:MAG TPA: helix-turn-helix transcriptional regulator, partial [Pseudonocardiaceae bacterium]|nr:helix-turn-helix transcriptional regulator [Pseudonocardiaceae bacterium]
RELGATMRRLRVAAGMTESSLAKKLSISHAHVCRMELGERNFTEITVARCLAYYGVFGAEHNEIMAVAREVNDAYRLKAHNDKIPDQLRALTHLEETASHIDSFEPSLIPGLLQTEDYARALFHWTALFPEGGIELRVKARMDRQKLLHQRNRPGFRFFIHESALTPTIISKEVMQEQLLLLILALGWADCEIRIVPADAGPAGGFGGMFMFLRYADYHPTVYVENIRTSEFLEDPADLLMYRSIMHRLATMALTAEQSREMLASLAT